MRHPTEQQILSMVDRHGFVRTDHQRLIGFRRRHRDGRDQFLGLFSWSGRKIAQARGIPAAYLVVCLGLDQAEECARYRLPLVDWPSTTQTQRPWRDVATEFKDVFIAALDADLAAGHRKLNGLGDRYILTPR